MIKYLILFFLLSSSAFAGVNFTTGTSSTPILACGTNSTILTGTAAETFGAWVYPTVDNVNSGSSIRIASRYATEASSGGVAELDITPTKAVEFIITTSGTAMQVLSNNNSISFNTYQYIMVTTDGSLTATNTHIYVGNAELSYAGQINGTGSVNTTTGTTLYLGNRGDASRPLSGYMMEAEDWNIQLTSAARAQAFNSAQVGYNMKNINPSSLQSWWRLNGCANGQTCSNTFTDEIGNNNCTGSNSPKGISPIYDYQVNGVLNDAVIK